MQGAEGVPERNEVKRRNKRQRNPERSDPERSGGDCPKKEKNYYNKNIEVHMIYSDFKGLKISQLGFGAMRLPCKADNSVDQEQVNLMTDFAIENGINYFDTAYPYHGGMSEICIGKALARHPRDKWFLATKYPGHQFASSYNPHATFEEQLKKCNVEYFDFYLLHNIYENSIKNYLNPNYKMVEYFIEERKAGRIKHLGFSTHADIPCLKEFLEAYGDQMEFCQIQLNYMDWTLQNAKAKYELLTSINIPIWVMEPLRGGKLASMPEKSLKELQAFQKDASPLSWAFRYLKTLPNVKVVLSGMSSLEQLKENTKIFAEEKPLSPKEVNLLYSIAESMKDSLPCTSCRYCTASCPKKLDIPELIKFYNDLKFQDSFTVSMRLESFEKDKLPSACIKCHKCESICPQKIKIADAMEELSAKFEKMPRWAELCRQREEAAKKAAASLK